MDEIVETFFSVNDLLRRKFQTSVVIVSLTLSVASTLFLLTFADKLGFGVLTIAEGKLTASFSIIFSHFISFLSFLVFLVGAIIISFLVFLMTSQRIRDIGLIRAAGCPNNLVFGYFMNELFIVNFAGCALGVILGVIADIASTNLLSSLGFQIPQGSTSIWLVLFVFATFFVVGLVLGAKPILDVTKITPIKALSPTYYLGLGKVVRFKAASKSGLTLKLALRSLSRRKSATFRIVLCLTTVFILITVAVAGGIIANQTTNSWIEKAVGKDVILIAHRETCDQYKLLLSKFHESIPDAPFNYTDERYVISEYLVGNLTSISGVRKVDRRLVLSAHVKEIRGYKIDPETSATIPIGDNRETGSLVIGVNPENMVNEWFLDGRLLRDDESFESIVGDSLARKIFTMPLNQSITLSNRSFDVVGVCLDPINNGNVTYVPLKTLQNAIGATESNIVLAKIDPLANYTETLNQIRTKVITADASFEVFELNQIVDENLGFIGYLWSTIMFLPMFSLTATFSCLTGYVSLVLAEQQHEFGVLRALGAKPRALIAIVAVQSLIVLVSSYAAGVSLGIITTLLILVPEPIITSYTVIEIASWLLVALAATFIVCLYPAVKLSRKPILEIMA
jgi:ABC-type antimicrobial peptide transport system permease subunit